MKNILEAIIITITIICSCACQKINEQPPLNEGYATEVIIPDPVDLTSAEREYLYLINKEYRDAE